MWESMVSKWRPRSPSRSQLSEAETSTRGNTKEFSQPKKGHCAKASWLTSLLVKEQSGMCQYWPSPLRPNTVLEILFRDTRQEKELERKKSSVSIHK